MGYDEHFDVTSWVLSKFSSEEYDTLQKDIFPKVEGILREHF